MNKEWRVRMQKALADGDDETAKFLHDLLIRFTNLQHRAEKAEAKLAEKPPTDPTDGEDSHRDGDDVLREWLNKVRSGDGFVDLQGDAVAELCRRALGGDA